LIHEALSKGNLVTKRCSSLSDVEYFELKDGRDIFYKDVKLFNTQHVVDRSIDDIARTFNVPRLSLNVVLTNLRNKRK